MFAENRDPKGRDVPDWSDMEVPPSGRGAGEKGFLYIPSNKSFSCHRPIRCHFENYSFDSHNYMSRDENSSIFYNN